MRPAEPADEADRGRHPGFALHEGLAGGPGSLSLSFGQWDRTWSSRPSRGAVMDWKTAFLIASLAPVPFWALMIFAPGWSVTRRLMESFVGPGLFAALYTALILPALPDILPTLVN